MDGLRIKYLTLNLLKSLKHQSSLPWICFGDFNEILYSSEKEFLENSVTCKLLGRPWSRAS